jgi:hypothetical protein
MERWWGMLIVYDASCCCLYASLLPLREHGKCVFHYIERTEINKIKNGTTKFKSYSTSVRWARLAAF